MHNTIISLIIKNFFTVLISYLLRTFFNSTTFWRFLFTFSILLTVPLSLLMPMFFQMLLLDNTRIVNRLSVFDFIPFRSHAIRGMVGWMIDHCHELTRTHINCQTVRWWCSPTIQQLVMTCYNSSLCNDISILISQINMSLVTFM